jgi:hypothetical protein
VQVLASSVRSSTVERSAPQILAFARSTPGARNAGSVSGEQARVAGEGAFLGSGQVGCWRGRGAEAPGDPLANQTQFHLGPS